MTIPKRLEGIHYIHLRWHDNQGHVSGHGGMTLAWSPVKEKDGEFTIKVGRSICSEKDNFWRKRGRELALQRMTTDRHLMNYMGVDLNGTIITRHTLHEDIHNTLENWAYNNWAQT